MKELTCGDFGGFRWYLYRFFISLDKDGLTVEVPFRRFTIPMASIDRLISEGPPPGILSMMPVPQERLRVVHHDLRAPKEIRFVSEDWNGWFSAFESHGIPTEDAKNVRHASTTYWRVSKRLGVFSRYFLQPLALLAATVTLAMLLYGLSRHGLK